MYFAEPRTLVGLLIACVVGRMNNYTGDQIMIQRFQTSKSIKDSRQGFIINAIGDSTWMLGLSFVGLGLFAYYQVHGLPAELQAEPDHTVPYFLRTMFPTGILGLTLAATLAASLSAIASAINSCTTVTMVDFYERLFKRKRSVPEQEMRDTHGEGRRDVALSRIITVFYGVIGVVIAASVATLGNIIVIAQKVIQTYTGPMLAIYLLGMFTTRANARGALLGGIAGTLLGIYIAFFCKAESLFSLHGTDRIAFLWPTVFGFVATLVGGYVFSILAGGGVSQRARELTWWSVMRRPLPQQDLDAAAAEERAVLRPVVPQEV
jgi:Na+/proline symporter